MTKMRWRYSIRFVLWGLCLGSAVLSLFFSKASHTLEATVFAAPPEDGLLDRLLYDLDGPNVYTQDSRQKLWKEGQGITIYDATDVKTVVVSEMPIVVHHAGFTKSDELPSRKHRLTIQVRFIDKIFLAFAGSNLFAVSEDDGSDWLWLGEADKIR